MKTQTIEKCTQCGEDCVLGVNVTTEHGNIICDECSNTERDHKGMVVQPLCCCYEILGDNPNCKVHGKDQ